MLLLQGCRQTARRACGSHSSLVCRGPLPDLFNMPAIGSLRIHASGLKMGRSQTNSKGQNLPPYFEFDQCAPSCSPLSVCAAMCRLPVHSCRRM